MNTTTAPEGDGNNEKRPDPNSDPRSKGGNARSESLTPEQRKEIAKRGAKARWEAAKAAAIAMKDPSRIPEATNEGPLTIGAVTIETYVLDNRKRVISKRGMARALDMKSGGGNVFLRAMNRKGLGSVIDENLREKINSPIVFKGLTGDLGHGYECTILIDICNAIIDAHKTGKLGAGQGALAIQAEIIVRASAKLGITALIDEATGFIEDKRKEEYRELFREYINEEFQSYKSQFPDQLFDMMFKIYGAARGENKNQRPRYFSKFIRKYIYEPLANSNGAILEQLDEKNPVVYVNGGRRYKMYGFLSEVVGLPALQAHLWQVVGIGNSVKTKAQFEKAFARAFPTIGSQTLMPFVDDEPDPA